MPCLTNTARNGCWYRRPTPIFVEDKRGALASNETAQSAHAVSAASFRPAYTGRLRGNGGDIAGA